MRLDYVEVSGFRGFRDKVRVNFGAGFTVITGRNGVGKSTICDAVEFAILGEIGKYPIESAAKESVKDYMWWRGDGTPEAHYVKAGFVDADGVPFIVTRSRETGVDKTPGELEAALCVGAVPEDPLRQLCKTSIIRDEWIAALSLDLSETQRFELVRAALGSIEGTDLATKSRSVVQAADNTVTRTEAVYEQLRAQLTTSLAELSAMNSLAERSGEIAAAMATLDNLIATTAGDLGQRLDMGRRELLNRRQRLAGMGEAIFQGREVLVRQAEFNDASAIAQREEARKAVAELRDRYTASKAELDEATRVYEIEARANEIASSLAALVLHGETLGLHDDHCPLCAAGRTNDEFNAGIAAARARIDRLAEGVNAASLVLEQARTRTQAVRNHLAEAESVWSIAEAAEASLRQLEQHHIEIFDRFGLDYAFATDPDGLEVQMRNERDHLVEVERSLNALESSRTIDRLASIDARVATLRGEIEKAADELSSAQSALARAKALDKSVKRSAAEIVDERLAMISPLLNELYQRLRPHSDWRSIEYSIRGDLKRFLSLKVGNDLNPQFVFSSGQRRAAGLAFLLSVHLARPWAKLTSLLLDDPVQHIDDFRALHLVEVLSAMRQSGRQIICAVEDEALGDLLCRRLASSADQPGRRVTIDTGAAGATGVARASDIAPMHRDVLRPINTQQAV